jgi:hypothetical protein
MLAARPIFAVVMWTLLFYGAYKLWQITLQTQVQNDAPRMRRLGQRVAKLTAGVGAVLFSLAVAGFAAMTASMLFGAI